jgi:hypothetical protein
MQRQSVEGGLFQITKTREKIIKNNKIDILYENSEHARYVDNRLNWQKRQECRLY